MKKVLVVFILVLCSPFVYSKNLDQSTRPQQLIQLIQQREAVMKDVAAFKFNRGISPYDAQRERAVLSNIEKQMGHSKNSAAVLVNAQILMDVSKQIEAYWMDYWEKKSH
ncbi:chorismate mutase [Piscirickettsia litoralis]|uniref:chorismate mutase n=1 Tax=Piscirickettsia litoralis TaxID=1891921 RepID=A0ABX2ZYN7_9GAMM|nr:chorismate mutase [Piscirickettsia litoralis]ODN41711.1 hypothetical protein BGC07_00320 [Piscirickettsia litoralis]